MATLLAALPYAVYILFQWGDMDHVGAREMVIVLGAGSHANRPNRTPHRAFIGNEQHLELHPEAYCESLQLT